MKITHDRLTIINRALNIITRKEFNDIVRVSQTNGVFEKLNTYGVNWSACGPQDPGIASDFAKHIQKAARIAKALQDMGLEFDGDYDKEDITPEDWEDENKTVLELLQNERFDCLAYWIQESEKKA